MSTLGGQSREGGKAVLVTPSGEAVASAPVPIEVSTQYGGSGRVRSRAEQEFSAQENARNQLLEQQRKAEAERLRAQQELREKQRAEMDRLRREQGIKVERAERDAFTGLYRRNNESQEAFDKRIAKRIARAEEKAKQSLQRPEVTAPKQPVYVDLSNEVPSTTKPTNMSTEKTIGIFSSEGRDILESKAGELVQPIRDKLPDLPKESPSFLPERSSKANSPLSPTTVREKAGVAFSYFTSAVGKAPAVQMIEGSINKKAISPDVNANSFIGKSQILGSKAVFTATQPVSQSTKENIGTELLFLPAFATKGISEQVARRVAKQNVVQSVRAGEPTVIRLSKESTISVRPTSRTARIDNFQLISNRPEYIINNQAKFNTVGVRTQEKQGFITRTTKGTDKQAIQDLVSAGYTEAQAKSILRGRKAVLSVDVSEGVITVTGDKAKFTGIQTSKGMKPVEAEAFISERIQSNFPQANVQADLGGIQTDFRRTKKVVSDVVSKTPPQVISKADMRLLSPDFTITGKFSYSTKPTTLIGSSEKATFGTIISKARTRKNPEVNVFASFGTPKQSQTTTISSGKVSLELVEPEKFSTRLTTSKKAVTGRKITSGRTELFEIPTTTKFSVSKQSSTPVRITKVGTPTTKFPTDTVQKQTVQTKNVVDTAKKVSVIQDIKPVQQTPQVTRRTSQFAGTGMYERTNSVVFRVPSNRLSARPQGIEQTTPQVTNQANIVRTSTTEGTISRSGTRLLTSPSGRTATKQEELLKQPQRTEVRTTQTLRSSSVLKTKARQALELFRGQKQKLQQQTIQAPKAKPRLIPLTKPSGSASIITKTSKQAQDKFDIIYGVSKRERQSFTGTFEEALKKAVSETRGSIKAGFAITKRGSNKLVPIDKSISGFSKSKSTKGFLVQEKTKRLSARGEVRDIISSRKGGRKNPFGL